MTIRWLPMLAWIPVLWLVGSFEAVALGALLGSEPWGWLLVIGGSVVFVAYVGKAGDRAWALYGTGLAAALVALPLLVLAGATAAARRHGGATGVDDPGIGFTVLAFSILAFPLAALAHSLTRPKPRVDRAPQRPGWPP